MITLLFRRSEVLAEAAADPAVALPSAAGSLGDTKRRPMAARTLGLATALGVTLAATTLFWIAPAMSAELKVHIESGVLQGRTSAAGQIRSFLGIPYAQAPIGNLRWKPPESAATWDGVRPALAPGPACMQPTGAPAGFYTDNPPRMSEDCLFLNVWAPSGARKAPVMLFIHGGSLINGSGMTPRYDGSKLAEKGVVVVTINYRLGVFGYFSHPELSAESPHHASGNYGTLDQIEALRWVKRNIAAFGGDPDRVTVFGQSAGALSVTHLMSSPLATGLFQAAIAHSAYMPAIPELQSVRFGLAPAETTGQDFGRRIGASTLTALRAMSADTLQAAATSDFGSFGMTTAVVDGWVQKAQIFETFEQGREAKIPFIAGFTSGEARAMDPGVLPPFAASAAEYEARVKDAYGDLAPEFLRLYPSHSVSDSSLAAARDAFFGWAVERLVRMHSRVTSSTWMYYFDHVYPSAAARGVGAFHSIDVPFVFGNVGPGAIAPQNWPKPPSDALDVAMSETEIDYWVAFARTGRPQPDRRPSWPLFEESQQAYLAFRDGAAIPSHHLLPGMFELQDAYMGRLRASGDTPWTWANIGAAASPIRRRDSS